jgi:hypothetical protein
MALNNESNPFLVQIDLGSIAADGSLAALYLPKKTKILGAWLIDTAGIAASDSNYVDVRLQNGSTVVAELDSRAAHENGLTALVAKAMNIVSGQEEQAAGSSLKVVYDETGTVQMTNAVMVLEMCKL